MAKSQISMQLYAGNTTRGRMLMNAGEANGGPAFRQLVHQYIRHDLRSGVTWNSQAVGVLAYAFGEYLVELLRKTHFVIWGTQTTTLVDKLRAVTGTLSTSIVSEITPLRTTTGEFSKMSANIIITHMDLTREEQSSLLSAMPVINDAGFPIIQSDERVSQYSSRALTTMFSMPSSEVDVQTIWLDLVHTHLSSSVLGAFLKFPASVQSTNAQNYEDLIQAIQWMKDKLVTENRDLIEQSAMARWQAHSAAKEASTRSGNSRKRGRR